jgi:hypothetical protein
MLSGLNRFSYCLTSPKNSRRSLTDREVYQSECVRELAMSNYAKDVSTASKGWHAIETAPKNKDVMLQARNAAGDTFLMSFALNSDGLTLKQ